VTQTLWQNTEYGMSIEQIQDLFPSSFVPNNPGWYSDGSIEYLRLNNYEIVNEKFTISFIFKNNKLNQVTLTCQNMTTKIIGELLFDNLVEVLTIRYGTPFIIKKDDNTVGSMWRYVWLSGRTNINLNFTSILDNTPMLNIVYQIHLIEESDKL
jgi:hypothetical protein